MRLGLSPLASKAPRVSWRRATSRGASDRGDVPLSVDDGVQALLDTTGNADELVSLTCRISDDGPRAAQLGAADRSASSKPVLPRFGLRPQKRSFCEFIVVGPVVALGRLARLSGSSGRRRSTGPAEQKAVVSRLR
jgi:hypothetical protein